MYSSSKMYVVPMFGFQRYAINLSMSLVPLRNTVFSLNMRHISSSSLEDSVLSEYEIVIGSLWTVSSSDRSPTYLLYIWMHETQQPFRKHILNNQLEIKEIAFTSCTKNMWTIILSMEGQQGSSFWTTQLKICYTIISQSYKHIILHILINKVNLIITHVRSSIG